MHDFAHLGAASGLGEPHGADDIHRGVERGVLDRVAHGDLRGEVKDHLGPNVCEKSVEVSLDDVGLDEFEVRGAISLTEIEIVA